jgi:hypothetical protein
MLAGLDASDALRYTAMIYARIVLVHKSVKVRIVTDAKKVLACLRTVRTISI